LRGRPVAAVVAPPAPWAQRGRLARWRAAERGPALAAALVCVLALAAAWAAFQPVRAVHASETAYDRLDAGQPAAAADIARLAAERDPLSVDPLFQLAAIEQARGRLPEAKAALERAVRLQPANAEAWRRMARLRLSALSDPKGALRAFQASLWLDPASAESVSGVVEAARAAG
jgi:tetratricopeptide (TPR) repeat protein